MPRRTLPKAAKKAVPPALRALIRRVGRTRRKQSQRIIARSMEILPHYRGISASERRAALDNVLYHLGLFYRVTLEQGRRLTSAEIERSRQNARLRASQGVPLGELLGVYQIGNAIVWEDLVASVKGNAQERGQLFERVASITANNIQLMTAITEAYVEERESLSRFYERDLDDFFQFLLAGDLPEGLLELRAKALGLRLGAPHTVVFIRPVAPLEAGAGGVGVEDARRLLAAATRKTGALVGRLPDGFILLLRGEPDRKEMAVLARRLFGDAVRMGIGGQGVSMAELRRSGREALRAIEIGSFVSGDGIVHRYRDHAVLDLVGVGSPEAEAFVQGVLGPPALRDANKPYLDTLRQFVRSGFRVKVAAAALSIHPHTLSYRLKQIKIRLGIDMEEAEARLRVQLALLIHDALDHSSR